MADFENGRVQAQNQQVVRRGNTARLPETLERNFEEAGQMALGSA